MGQALRHILCIDDEEDILRIAKESLETLGGFEVTCCNSGEDALALMESLHPDMILLDAMMPGMNGAHILKRLQESASHRRIPVVFLTARVKPAALKEYLAHGALSTIPKPFDPMLLPRQVLNIWQRGN